MLTKSLGKCLLLLLGISLCLTLQVAYATDQMPATNSVEIKLKLNDPQVSANGQSTTLKVAPTLVNSTTMVPLRFIGESLGVDVKWDEITRTITLSTVMKTIQLTLDRPDAIVNGTSVTLDQPATILNETTMVPLRFITENLNQTVVYDNSAHTITITGRKAEPTPVEQFKSTASVKKKMDKPTVDNLTTELGQSVFISTPQFVGAINAANISGVVSGKDNNVYMINFNSNRSSLSKYVISVYNQKSGDGRNLQHEVIFNEKFNTEYKDKKNNVQKLMYFDLIPQKLFYDELHEKLYMLASVDALKIDITTVIYEILPEVKMVTYSLDDWMNVESNFFATVDEEHFYYSNTFLSRIYSLHSGETQKTIGVSSNQKPSLVSVVNGGRIYLLDKVNKSVSKLNADGTISEVVKVNIENINGASSRDGYFYIADEKGFYRVDIHGKIEDYVKLDHLFYNQGLFSPKTQTYEQIAPNSVGISNFPGAVNSSDDHEPGALILGINPDFTVDVKGNIIINDKSYHIIRRINVF
ncbi:copper amine oxidase N-terminal domain-containing protein [Paenibacillus alba]|uniref:Copper amine oxidase N-terminal domain-containing protein n=1 Tax=Paenibacillus alba TaxID=1197127 RepID=A0ABU6FWB3_9BACL|nr:copper amine oxidase N-terminal domain-containing protein [Paenibacillus alba]MEC0226203.1 copper amine oxidase N-terminal domain-containing protein [Paenibacillus alba]